MKKKYYIIVAVMLLLVGCSSKKMDTYHMEIGKSDAGLDVPIIKTSDTDKIAIGKMLFEEYLKITYENYKNEKGNYVNILKDYKINDIKLDEDLGNGDFLVSVDYDLQSIDGYIEVFKTGNGVESSDNWVKNKYFILKIQNVDKNKYKLSELYTG